MDGIRDTIGWAGTMLSMFFYFYPAIPFLYLYQGKLNYEETPAFIVSSNYVSCFCWTIYGSIIGSEPLQICNLIGTLLNLVLICFYLFHEIKKYRDDAITNAIILVLGSFAVYKGFNSMNYFENTNSIGKICIITSLAEYIYPIQLIYKVLKEKKYNLISINTEYISAMAYFCWFLYGITLFNIYVIIPNIVGIGISGIQIYIFNNFKTGRNIPEEKESSPTIGIEKTKASEGKKEDNNTNKDDEEKHINEKDETSTIIEKVDN